MRASHAALAVLIGSTFALGPAVRAGQPTPPPGPPATVRADSPAAEVAPAPEPANLDRLRARILERWRVVQVRDGLVLVPRRGGGDLRGVELSGDQVLIDGQPVSGGELRSRLGGDAEAVLALSFLSEAARASLFEPQPRGGRQAPEPPSSRAGRETERRGPVLRYHGARVRIGSSLVIGEGERVEDAAVAILGSVTVDGEVAGDVVAVGGGVRLGPHAVVRGSVTSVGGRIDAHPDARVLGESTEVALSWPAGEEWTIPVGHDMRVRLWPDRSWWASAALVTTSVRLALAGLLGLVVILLGGRLYDRTRAQVSAVPWQAIIVGIGAQVLFVPLLVLLCGALLVSIVGIPLLAVVPLGLVVFGALWLVGFAAVGERIGQRLLGAFGLGQVPSALAFVVGFACVAVLSWTARWLWWADWIGVGAALGLGIAGALIEGVVWSAGLGALILVWLRRPQESAAIVVPPPLGPPADEPAVR